MRESSQGADAFALRPLYVAQEDSFSAKVIAALRNEFGGHAVKKG